MYSPLHGSTRAVKTTHSPWSLGWSDLYMARKDGRGYCVPRDEGLRTADEQGGHFCQHILIGPRAK